MGLSVTALSPDFGLEEVGADFDTARGVVFVGCAVSVFSSAVLLILDGSISAASLISGA